VTSALFPNQKFSLERLQAFSASVGKDRLVVDVRYANNGEINGEGLLNPLLLSCRKRGDKWIVAMNKWQDLTDMEVNQGRSFLPFVSAT
jgi:phosphoribosylformimino-5-aminoimidazole carboxamide ribotide isomerase